MANPSKFVPQTEGKAAVSLIFEDITDRPNWSEVLTGFEFKGMMNGGYTIRAEIADISFALTTKLLKSYFKDSRSEPFKIRFRIFTGPGEATSQRTTKEQVAYVVSMRDKSGPADVARLEFIAIDPPSWHLNRGKGGGEAYTGRISQVIQQVIDKYAADDIHLDIAKTNDSEHCKWYMMRQDPKTFIMSLLEWSSAVTASKTNLIIGVDGKNLSMIEQAKIKSKPRGYYKFGDVSTIHKAESVFNNALSLVNNKLITQGISIVSGKYYDIKADEKEDKIVIKDETTSKKQFAKTDERKSFNKPNKPLAGYTSIIATPEIYSSGDIGLTYGEYIDGRARDHWLRLSNSLMRCKFTVVGHGEYSDTLGLGADTIFIKWLKEPTDDESSFYMSGYWILYGFHHKVVGTNWWTDLYCARFDHNAAGEQVGGDFGAI